jgi:hypothetical protein
MSIPTEQDRALAEIEELAAAIRTRLTTFRYTGGGEQEVATRRSHVQNFANKVIAFARKNVRSSFC